MSYSSDFSYAHHQREKSYHENHFFFFCFAYGGWTWVSGEHLDQHHHSWVRQAGTHSLVGDDKPEQQPNCTSVMIEIVVFLLLKIVSFIIGCIVAHNIVTVVDNKLKTFCRLEWVRRWKLHKWMMTEVEWWKMWGKRRHSTELELLVLVVLSFEFQPFFLLYLFCVF